MRVRNEVRKFSEVMDRELATNWRWESGWQNMSLDELINLIRLEVNELERNLEEHKDHGYRNWIDRMPPNAVSAACIAMMIHDNITNGRIKIDDN